jgi:hypothetical protein
MTVVGCLLFGIGGCPMASVCPTMTGQSVIDSARGLGTPIGFGARALYAEYQKNSFETNVLMSNAWIQGQVDFYEKADSCYMMYLDEMMNGGGVEGGLGMRQWLSDPENVQFWDNFIQKNIGDDGYARLIALNGAFGPGSDSFEWTYGGIRRYSADSQMLMLDGAAVAMDKEIGAFEEGLSSEAKFAFLVLFGHNVRMAMYDFYDAFAAGQVTAAEVADFNEAYIVAGGCAITSTDSTQLPLRESRYLAGLNYVGVKLTELGYTVEAPMDDECPPITGQDVVDSVRSLETPLGFGARDLYAEYQKNSFEMNVQMSNAWIQGQVEFFEKADSCTMAYLDGLMNGGGEEEGLGMRQWLSDPENVQFWDNFIQKNVGEDGYARLIALNGAFGPGSDSFQWTYGGIRQHHGETGMLTLDGLVVATEEAIAKFGEGLSSEAKFALLVAFGHNVRLAMYDFYDDFAEGIIDQDTVSAFNEYYVIAGGCGIASTDTTKSTAREDRYLAALNFMGVKLIEMGYDVSTPE